jgi:hypothetical protein
MQGHRGSKQKFQRKIFGSTASNTSGTSHKRHQQNEVENSLQQAIAIIASNALSTPTLIPVCRIWLACSSSHYTWMVLRIQGRLIGCKKRGQRLSRHTYKPYLYYMRNETPA